MTTKLKIQVLMLMAAVAVGVNAAPVDVVAARGVASRFVVQAATAKMMSPTASLKLARTEASSTRPHLADYYVFNAADGQAFVIVSGDDRAEAVLAYGEGAFDVDNVPCNLRAMLGCYREQLEWLHAHPGAVVERPVPYNDVTIPPLLTCDWGQQAPFYNQCPVYEGERSVTGCVATAMAQVMFYWRYPDHLPSLNGYRTRSHRISVSALPGADLDWDSMLSNYGATPYSNAQSAAVATLMRYCGQAVRMDYSPTGSGAYVTDQLSAMKTFGYNPGATALLKTGSSYDQWDELLQQELLAGRPILYSASDPAAGGHAFVVDGYSDGKYHVNWGWNGNYNGYFALGAFNVRGYKFLFSQEILSDLYPPTTAPTRQVLDFESDGIYYRYGDGEGEAYVSCRDTEYGSYSGDVVVPGQVTHDGQTFAVTAIDDNAFRNCVELTSVTLPTSLTRIGELAFNNCVALTQMQIPEGVTTIDALAFASCFGLQSLSLPASLHTVNARAFVECLSLITVYTPSIESWLSIRFADSYANPVHVSHRLHVGGHDLKNLVVPDGVEEIGQYAFAGCIGLKSVTIADGVGVIGKSAFKDCAGLSSLTLPSAMSSLGTQAFAGCTALTTVSVPAGIDCLSDALFKDCTALTSVTLHSGPTAIGSEAFASCSRLQSIAVPEGVSTIGPSAFKSCTALASVTLPESLSAIGTDAFNGCSALTAVSIPDQVQTVKTSTFNGCTSLTDITFGQQLASIEQNAFAGCRALARVTCLGNEPATIANPDCFVRSIYNTALLMVPAEARPVYKRTGIWPWFKRMVGVNIGCPYGDVNGDGEVNIADVNAVIDGILGGEPQIVQDVSGDGEVNIADVNTLIDLILTAH